MQRSRTLLENWLLEAEASGQIDGALVRVVGSLVAAVKELSDILRVAAIEGNSGYYGLENVHGEAQKRLDVVADEIFSRHLERTNEVGAFISEEQVGLSDQRRPSAPYLVCFDPLDGSSNSDVNMTVGSIFSIHRWIPGDEATLFLRGREQLVACFAAYGPATTLVITLGGPSALFQLDWRLRSFVLIESELRIPPSTAEYAINSSRSSHWDTAVAKYIGERTNRVQPFNMRWTGSMVADVQRILRRGGIFLYPADKELAHRGGRLRLLYEASPMAMIIEQAGGRATTGTCDLLDLVAGSIHQRVPVILGSADEVEHVIAGYGTSSSAPALVPTEPDLHGGGQ